MNSKEVYIKRICDGLNAAYIRDVESYFITELQEVKFTPDSFAIKELMWLPEENLEKAADTDFKQFDTFKEVYQHWMERQIFKFDPYVYITESDLPVLVLKNNRFMSARKGIFRITCTPDGKGQCTMLSFAKSSSIFNPTTVIEDLSKSELYFMILYAGMLNTGFQHETFARGFYNNRQVIDEFFHESMKYWHLNFDYGFGLIDKNIHYEQDTLLNVTSRFPVYEINLKGRCYCRFMYTDKEVKVEYNPTLGYNAEPRIATLNVPDTLAGMNEHNTQDFHANRLNAVFDNSQSFVWRRELVLMMLKFIGVNASFNGINGIRKIGYIEPANNDTVVQFRNSKDFIEKLYPKY